MKINLDQYLFSDESTRAQYSRAYGNNLSEALRTEILMLKQTAPEGNHYANREARRIIEENERLHAEIDKLRERADRFKRGETMYYEILCEKLNEEALQQRVERKRLVKRK